MLVTFKEFGRGLSSFNDGSCRSITTSREGTNLHNLIGTIVLEGDPMLCRIERE